MESQQLHLVLDEMKLLKSIDVCPTPMRLTNTAEAYVLRLRLDQS
jgi:hypothetical protein